MRGLKTWWPYYLMMPPGVIYFALFHFMPIWEAKLAFEDFRIIGDNTWVGFKHYETLFSSPIFMQVLLNTLIISGMKMLFVFPVPIFLALMINEVRPSQIHPVRNLLTALPVLGCDRRYFHCGALALKWGG